MARRKPRVRGLQRPFSLDQRMTWGLQPTMVAAYVLIVANYVPSDERALLLLAYAAVVAVLMGCWLYCSLTDPKSDGGPACPCMREAQKATRFCALCRKSVPGLDHHCSWLNTCVGKRTYPQFYVLTLCGSLQYALQTLVSVRLLTDWYDAAAAEGEDSVGSESGFGVLMWAHLVLAGGLLLAFGSLWLFHTYLLAVGYGTYDFLIKQRTRGETAPADGSHVEEETPSSRAREAKQAAVREEWRRAREAERVKKAKDPAVEMVDVPVSGEDVEAAAAAAAEAGVEESKD